MVPFERALVTTTISETIKECGGGGDAVHLGTKDWHGSFQTCVGWVASCCGICHLGGESDIKHCTNVPFTG